MPIEYETLKEHLQSVIGAPTMPNPNPSSDCNRLETTQDWVRQSQVDGEWNNSLLQVTKNMVQEGESDETIHTFVDALNTEDYTLKKGRKQVQSMIDGVRALVLCICIR